MNIPTPPSGTRGRRFGALALLVLLLGVLAAPLADARLHAEEGSRSGLVHGTGDECDLCRVAAIPLLQVGTGPEIARTPPTATALLAVPRDGIAPPAPLASVQPPSRGPPA